MNNQQPNSPHKTWWRRLSALFIIVMIVSISWAIMAEYLLRIERKDWIWVPVYLALLALYWVPAWGAIASQAEGIADRKVKLAKTGGCLLAALVVFLVICALLAILFMQ